MVNDNRPLKQTSVVSIIDISYKVAELNVRNATKRESDAFRYFVSFLETYLCF